MITNFEEITADLTAEEKKLIPILVKGFNLHVGKDNAIKAPAIVEAINSRLPILGLTNLFNESRLRKLTNFIRSNGLLPLIATPSGYYITKDKEEIRKQVQSLQDRADAILAAKRGLEKLL